jgi:hypothetical protein
MSYLGAAEDAYHTLGLLMMSYLGAAKDVIPCGC